MQAMEKDIRARDFSPPLTNLSRTLKMATFDILHGQRITKLTSRTLYKCRLCSTGMKIKVKEKH